MRTTERVTAVAACLAIAIGATACSSEEEAASEESGFTFGYSKPTGQNPWMNTIEASAYEVAEAAGGSGETTDAQLDVARAVQQVSRFITDGVEVVVVAPAQVPEAIQATLEEAQSAGIVTLALEWSFGDDPSAAPTGPVDGQAAIDRAKLGEEVAAEINEAFPGGAEVVYIGLPFPVAAIDAFEANFTAALGSSELVANVDNPTDNAQGALGPLQGALAANPGTDAIVTYNGPSAIAAVQAVQSAGLEDHVKVYNIQADDATINGLTDGSIAAVWDLNPPSLGTALGKLIAAAGSGEDRSEWAKTVLVDPVKYTTDNAADWEDWTV